jgi:hypothetical protein
MSKLIAVALVLLVIALAYAGCGLIFALLWNWLVPALWHAAPHLSWKAGVAVAWLLVVLQSVFGRAEKGD